jgi:hypothetical protein
MLGQAASGLLQQYGGQAGALQSIQGGANAIQAGQNLNLLSGAGTSFIGSYLASNQPGYASLNALNQQALQGLNPVSQVNNGSLNALNQTAQQQLALGTSVSPQQAATVANQVLSNYNSAGRANDPTAIAGLATSLDTYGQGLLQQRENAASNAAGLTAQQGALNQQAQLANAQQNIAGLNTATQTAYNAGQGGYNSLLSQSNAVNNAFNATTQAGQTVGAGVNLAGMYNPFNSAYNNVYSTISGANATNAATNAGLFAGGLNSLTGLLGSSGFASLFG